MAADSSVQGGTSSSEESSYSGVSTSLKHHSSSEESTSSEESSYLEESSNSEVHFSVKNYLVELSTSSEESSYSEGSISPEESSCSGVNTSENDSFSKRNSIVHVPPERKSYSKGRKNKRMKGSKRDKISRDSFCGDDIIITKSSICSSMHEDIVVEILSRLPVKTLFRFKCLCKRLRFLIIKDQQFIDLHLTQAKSHPRLFIVIPRFFGYPRGSEKYFLTADLLENRGIAKTTPMHILMEKTGLEGIIKPVNGLMCCHVGNAVRIYNVSTREITPWIKSPQRKLDMPFYEENVVQFGYDPATKKHKVIMLWETDDEFRNRRCVCSVLTVEEKKWRTIDEGVPPMRCFNGKSIYVDGSIYWFRSSFHKDDYYNNNMDEKVFFIVVFDVCSEKFRRIVIPNFISDQPRDEFGFRATSGKSVQLVELDGRVAIVDRISDFTVKLWILDDDYDKYNENITITTSNICNSIKWTEETFTIPFRWRGSLRIIFHTAKGIKDHIILEANRMYFKFRRRPTSSYYLYDWRKKSFARLKITGIPREFQGRTLCILSTFSESLLRVQ